MPKFKPLSLFFLRISLGGLFFYAGITKVVNPQWSAAGYLRNAKTLSGFYSSLTDPAVLPYVNFFNKWGLLLIGVSLILGAFVMAASLAGASMMFLYYLPVLQFPKVGDHSFLVDEHIIYIAAFLVLFAHNAGMHWGLDQVLMPKLKKAKPKTKK